MPRSPWARMLGWKMGLSNMKTEQIGESRKSGTCCSTMWRKPAGPLIGPDNKDRYTGPLSASMQLQACPAMHPPKAPSSAPPGTRQAGASSSSWLQGS